MVPRTTSITNHSPVPNALAHGPRARLSDSVDRVVAPPPLHDVQHIIGPGAPPGYARPNAKRAIGIGVVIAAKSSAPAAHLGARACQLGRTRSARTPIAARSSSTFSSVTTDTWKAPSGTSDAEMPGARGRSACDTWTQGGLHVTRGRHERSPVSRESGLGVPRGRCGLGEMHVRCCCYSSCCLAFERTSIHGRSANCVRILSRTASWSAGDDWSPHVPARQDATWNVRDQLNA